MASFQQSRIYHSIQVNIIIESYDILKTRFPFNKPAENFGGGGGSNNAWDQLYNKTNNNNPNYGGGGFNQPNQNNNWGQGAWGINNWGDQADTTFSVTGLSATLSQGVTIEPTTEINEGWGRLTWGENAWGIAGDIFAESG